MAEAAEKSTAALTTTTQQKPDGRTAEKSTATMAQRRKHGNAAQRAKKVEKLEKRHNVRKNGNK